MKKLNVGVIGLVLSLAAATACGGNSQAAGQAKGVKAQKGQVLVTNSLDVDFSGYKVTFIEIGADRCIPCKRMQPIMKEIAAEFPEDVQVVFCDVWKDPEPARKYSIQLIPTQVLLDLNGKEFHRHVGFYPKEDLLGVLAQKGVKK
jgi:thioredoxin 1